MCMCISMYVLLYISGGCVHSYFISGLGAAGRGRWSWIVLNTSTAQNHGAIVHLRRGSPSIPWLDLGKSMVENNVFLKPCYYMLLP